MKKITLLAVAALLFFSCSQSTPELNSVKTPSMDPPAGKYSTEQYVNMAPREDGVVYYTTDGSIPSASNGLPYENPVYVSIANSPLTIYAVTVKDGETSEVAGGVYTICPSLSSIISMFPFTGQSIPLYGVVVTWVDAQDPTRFTVQELNGGRAILVNAGITGVSVGNTLDLIVQAGSGGSGAWDTITAATVTSNDGGSASINKESITNWYSLYDYNESRIVSGSNLVVTENEGAEYELISLCGNSYLFDSAAFSSVPAIGSKVNVSSAVLKEGTSWVFVANPADVTVTEDTTPPVLSSTYPVNGETNVYTWSNIYFYLDEQIDPDTVDASAISITPAHAGNVYYSSYDRAVYFRPSTRLTANTDYTVSIPAATVKDYAGNAFGDASITFTTSL